MLQKAITLNGLLLMMIRISYYSLLLIIFQACDCHVYVEGKVFSGSVQKPVEGVSVELVNKGEVTKTDKNGYFKIEKKVGFCFDPTVRITKKYYKPFEITFKSSRESKIFSIKSKSDFVTYDTPFYPDPDNKNTFVTGTWINQYSINFPSILTSAFFIVIQLT